MRAIESRDTSSSNLGLFGLVRQPTQPIADQVIHGRQHVQNFFPSGHPSQMDINAPIYWVRREAGSRSEPPAVREVGGGGRIGTDE